MQLADTLAIPGDYTRGALSGKMGERVTAREFLRHHGIEPETEFDFRSPISTLPAGLAVLGTDILTDPTTLLGGFGALTKTGKIAKDIGGLRRLARAGKAPGTGPDIKRLTRGPDAVETLKRLRKKAPRGERSLRPTWRSQGEAGQRALVHFDVPFTDINYPLVRGAPVLAAAEWAGKRLPFSKLANQLVNRRGALGSSKYIAQLGDVAISTANARARRRARDLTSEQELLIKQRVADQGLSFDEAQDQFFRDIRDARESIDAADTLGDPSRASAAAAARTRLDKLAPNELEFATKLNKMVRESFKEQLLSGARSADFIEDYAERILSEEGRDFLRANKLNAPFKEFVRKNEDEFSGINGLNTMDPSQIHRKSYLRDKLTTDVDEFFRSKGFEGKSFFNLNPAETVAETIRLRDKSIIHADLARAFAREHANVPGRAGDMLLPEFIEKTKLHRFGKAVFDWKKIRRKAGESKTDYIARTLEGAGINPRTTLPLEAAKEFSNTVSPIFNVTGKLAEMFGLYDVITTGFRFALTQPFAGFHFRNNTSNVILNYIGGVKNPKFYADAARALIATDETLARSVGPRFGIKFDASLQEELTGMGVIQGGHARTITEELVEGSKRGLGPVGRRLERILEKTRGHPIGKLALLTGQVTEDVSRIAHYLSKRADGVTKVDAAASVNKYLFDYSNRSLTQFEKEIANRLFFFYRFTRFATPLMFRSLLEHPRRAALVLKATTQPGVERPGGMPLWLKQSAAIPSPRDEETGERSYLTGLGSPFEEFQKFDFFTGGADEPGAFAGFAAAGNEFKNLLAPILKVVAQLGEGKDFFLQQKLQEANRSPLSFEIPGIVDKVTSPTGKEQYISNPWFRFAVTNSPASRLVSTVDHVVRGARGDQPWEQAALRILTGARTYSRNEDEERARAAERVIRRKLLENPNVRGGDYLYAVGEGKKDPLLQEQFKQHRRVAKLNRKLRERKKK
tara:strand:+ start:2325 stop:5243 length:2919 start_codon:yes stop_codon:yes gene_type:complete